MDVTRSLLIGAAAVLSFMLLTEWVNFREERAPAPPVATEIISVPDSQPTLATPTDIPAAAVDTDIPVVTEAEPESGPTASSVASSNLISIKTDVLELIIDLNGGDVIQSALPAYPARLDDPSTPILLLENSNRRSYIAQSGLIGRDGIDAAGRAVFTTQANQFSLADSADELVVDLEHNAGDIDVIKRFRLTRSDYLVEVEYIVSNNSTQRWQGNLFGQIKRDSSPDPSQELASGMGMMPFLGVALTQPDERFTKFDFEEMAEKPYKQKLEGGWIAMIQHYFLSAWIPANGTSNTYSTRVTGNGFNIGGFVGPGVVIDPGQSGTISAGLYLGPKDQYRLAEISEYLDLSVDYGWLWCDSTTTVLAAD